MRKQEKLFSAFVCLLLASAPAVAVSGLSATAAAGYFIPSDSYGVSAGVAGSLSLGYQFSEKWGLEATYLTNNSELESAAAQVELDHYRLDALYHFKPDERLSPFIAVGAGSQTLRAYGQGVSNTLLSTGLGLHWALNNRLSLRSELRMFNDIDYSLVNYNLGLGLRLRLGSNSREPSAKATEAAMRLDTDGDFVRDRSDRCPNTPLGAEVDAFGCEMAADLSGSGL